MSAATTAEDQRAWAITQWLAALNEYEICCRRRDEAKKRLEVAENDLGHLVVPAGVKPPGQFNFWHKDKLYTVRLDARDPYGQEIYKVYHYDARPELIKETG